MMVIAGVVIAVIIIILVISLISKLNKMDSALSRTQGDCETIRAECKCNQDTIELLKKDNESLNEIIEKQKQDLKILSDAIKNYTDIREDSLKLNVTDEDQVLDEADLASSASTSKYIINYADLDSEKQDVFFEMENTNRNLFITGKAGTGKSYLLKFFRQNTTKNALYTAPTGISALNIEGVTLHRAFGFNNLQENHPINISKNKKKLLEGIDTIVIDEISMVRVDVFDRISSIFQQVMDNDEPFGGKQVIILGDLFQLPPVANRGETEYLTDKYGGIYFFDAPAYRTGNFAFRELKNIHRQSEGQFIDILNRAREGKLQNEDVEKLNEKYTTEVPKRVVQVVAKKDEASRVNEQNLKKIPSTLHVYEAEFPEGTEGIKENDFPCNFSLELKEGALVMMIANDLEHDRWVNGTLGIISRLRNDFIEVTINGIPYVISKKSFSTYKCEYNIETKRLEYIEDKTVIQFPVILAYAITIHKSQGMTYQRIACNLDDCFAPGQAYVALSRCANFSELYLTSKVSIESFFTDGALVDFYKEVSG